MSLMLTCPPVTNLVSFSILAMASWAVAALSSCHLKCQDPGLGSRSRLEKKSGAGAPLKLAGSSVLRDNKKHKETDNRRVKTRADYQIVGVAVYLETVSPFLLILCINVENSFINVAVNEHGIFSHPVW